MVASITRGTKLNERRIKHTGNIRWNKKARNYNRSRTKHEATLPQVPGSQNSTGGWTHVAYIFAWAALPRPHPAGSSTAAAVSAGRRRASPWHSSRARRFGQTFELTRTIFVRHSRFNPWKRQGTNTNRPVHVDGSKAHLHAARPMEVYGRLVLQDYSREKIHQHPFEIHIYDNFSWR